MSEEKKEELEQKEPSEVSEEMVSIEESAEKDSEEDNTEPNIQPNEMENAPQAILEEETAPRKKAKPAYTILLIALLALGLFWRGGMLPSGGNKVAMPVAYAKGDALYLYDLKNEPYQITDKLSAGGNYHYYYSAWGVNCTEDAKMLYYCSDVDKNGTFRLYRKELSSPEQEGVLIDEKVMDYQVSKNGEVCAYLVQDEQGGTNLTVYNGQKHLITKEIPLLQDAYLLSQNGKYIAYQKQVGQNEMNLYVNTIGTEGETLLGEGLQMTAFAKNADCIYYVVTKGKSYNIYTYSFGQKATLIAEKATAMELLENGKDLMYCTQSDSKIKCKDIIVNDTAQAEGEKKASKNPLYTSLENQEWDSPMQNCYVWSDGKVTEVAKEILQATVVKDKSGFVLYSTIDTSSINPVKVSEIQSEDEARYAYFSSLAAAPRLTYLVRPGDTAAPVEKTNIDSDGFLVSPNMEKVAFQEVDAQTGSTKLFTASLGKSKTLSDYQELAAGAQTPSYTGSGESLYYITDLVGGVGKLNVFANGESKSISEKVSGFSVADDLDIAYFISDTDEKTGNGTLQFVEKGTVRTIDTDVFCMQYKEKGNLVYIKNYDIASGKGDLYYWNGKESKLLDEGITAIFIY
ncbi:MAG: hypothetical protein GX299_00365 [Epulopiscium sp.]|nr:hypothetical protein [Candidatus Epulonipiscium sp.]